MLKIPEKQPEQVWLPRGRTVRNPLDSLRVLISHPNLRDGGDGRWHRSMYIKQCVCHCLPRVGAGDPDGLLVAGYPFPQGCVLEESLATSVQITEQSAAIVLESSGELSGSHCTCFAS